MYGDKRFNVRVYGIWVESGRVLISDEEIKGQSIIKFPGGGVEYGEGTIDALKREWKEELDIDIQILEHFYTTDYFQKSVFDDTQVISIFYKVQPQIQTDYIFNKNNNESCYWVKLEELTEDTFTLPIEKRVAKLLIL